jgi:hypothetical protein
MSDDTTDETIATVLKAIDAEYDLGSNFFVELHNEDDWSFVIKAHALIEASVAQLLTQHFGDERLRRVFHRLEIANTSTGRLAFVRALGLLSEAESRFVRSLAELRNNLVHQVHNVRFAFADYLAGMDSNQRKAFADWVTYAYPPDQRQDARKAVDTGPKTAMWNATLIFLVSCLNKTRDAKHRHRIIGRALEVASDFEWLDDDL